MLPLSSPTLDLSMRTNHSLRTLHIPQRSFPGRSFNIPSLAGYSLRTLLVSPPISGLEPLPKPITQLFNSSPHRRLVNCSVFIARSREFGLF
ncbi:hypothetical protein Sjap_024077 [Stephania japonica]|uniref:Uncharacterized protein n=1 Tax=Stephania japonica TaxID=461633 RepID=A0AAP0HPT5_9MAGN